MKCNQERFELARLSREEEERKAKLKREEEEKKKKREELLHQRRDEEMIQALLGKFSVNDESSNIASEVCDDNELDDSFFS